MSFDHLKHPLKKRLDIAEAVALELLIALDVAGIKVKNTLEDDVLFLYIMDLPEGCRLGLELDFTYDGAVLELICKSCEDPEEKKNSFFRLFWDHESGWNIELETVAPDLPVNRLALSMGKHHGLDRKGDTRSLAEGERDVIFKDMIEFIQMAPVVERLKEVQ